MTPKQKAECEKAMNLYKNNLCEKPTNTEFLEGDFSHGYQAALNSEVVKKLVEALKFYAGRSEWKGAQSEWDGMKFLTFDKFGCLDSDIMSPYIAEQALAEFGGSD